MKAKSLTDEIENILDQNYDCKPQGCIMDITTATEQLNELLSSAITRTVEETCDEIYKNLTDLYEDKCRHFKRSPLTSDLEIANFNNLLSGTVLSQKVIDNLLEEYERLSKRRN